MSPERRSLDRLLSPQSIAIVGASPEPLTLGNNVLSNIDAFGFAGAVHLVSRRHKEINGRACVASITELPDGVDVVALVVPAGAVRQAVEDCASIGAGGIVTFAAGFAELGEEGEQQQAEIARIAGDAGMAMLGPNCLGFINFSAAAPVTFERIDPVPMTGMVPPEGPGVAVIAQSGAMTGNIREALRNRGVRVACAISTGNEAVSSIDQILNHLVDDPAISTFAVFAEQLRDPTQFLSAVERTRELNKPVVLMHPGRSERSREAAQSHTGAMAGDHAVMSCFVTAAGVDLVGTFDELFDTTALRHRFGFAPLRGIGISTNSGAVRGLCLDLCEDLDLPLPRLSDEASGALSEVLPDYATIDNPLDITAAGMADPTLFGTTAAAMLNDPSVDALLIAAMGGAPRQVMAKWNSLKPVLTTSNKPVALTFLGDELPMPQEFLAEVRSEKVSFFRSPERALRALAIMAQRDPIKLPQRAKVTADGGARRMLPEYEGKARLREAGLPVPEGTLARSPDDAEAIFARIGTPVALKVQAASIAHKSDIGGVKLNISDTGRLREAWAEIENAVASSANSPAMDGILVEAMSAPFGAELIVSVRRDPSWGTVFVIGMGGVLAELLQDIRMIPAGAGHERYLAELKRLKGAAVLSGWRGGAALDVDAVAALLTKLDHYMLDDTGCVEIEINPLAVHQAGDGVTILDVLMSRSD